MMEQFKVWDWARDESDKYPPFQVDEDDLSQLPAEDNYLLNNFKSWQPKVGEWCWFWNVDEAFPVLRQFTQMTEEGFYCANIIVCEWAYKHCAPFIGQLPKILKD